MGVQDVGKKFYKEVGVAALVATPRDAKVLCLQRLLRLFGYGGTTLILALYLSDLGFSDTKTGLFMTLTLVGDAIISVILTIFADKIGRRVTLAIGSILLIASGAIFALSDTYWLLLLAGILGVISPSANEIDPFKAVEESTVSLLSSLEDRSSVFAWYILFGMAGQAAGTILTGWAVEQLQTQWAWTSLDAYRVIFWIYAATGVLKLLSCFFLTSDCERGAVRSSASSTVGERRPLLDNDNDESTPTELLPRTGIRGVIDAFMPQISKESWVILSQLCFLFALDSLASGLAPTSWMTFYFNRKFGTGEGLLGSILFVSAFISSALNLVSASLSRYIGLIRTMVTVHLPASVVLAIIWLPNNAAVALALLVFRMATKDMDMAPRQAFVAATVLEEERTAVMGVINVIRTVTISVGPVITGALSNGGRFWIAFLVAGCLKIAYNLLIVTRFWNYETKEEKELKKKTQEENTISNDRANGHANGYSYRSLDTHTNGHTKGDANGRANGHAHAHG